MRTKYSVYLWGLLTAFLCTGGAGPLSDVDAHHAVMPHVIMQESTYSHQYLPVDDVIVVLNTVLTNTVQAQYPHGWSSAVSAEGMQIKGANRRFFPRRLVVDILWEDLRAIHTDEKKYDPDAGYIDVILIYTDGNEDTLFMSRTEAADFIYGVCQLAHWNIDRLKETAFKGQQPEE